MDFKLTLRWILIILFNSKSYSIVKRKKTDLVDKDDIRFIAVQPMCIKIQENIIFNNVNWEKVYENLLI